ncbi:phosphatase PAP2 family protein [Fodinicurvata sp. EGI_FJ10296]|uniref:phosphatase PAP2 family protein n=1 Tax=Fodinicurvata sp. EGI_FJ10296 TaxID=3231908 RepID=UPI00345195E4
MPLRLLSRMGGCVCRAMILCIPLIGGLAVPGAASAQEAGAETSRIVNPFDTEYLLNYPRVAGQALRQPFRTDREGLTQNALALAGIGLAFALDESVQRSWQNDLRSNGSDDVSEPFYEMGVVQNMAIGTGSAYLVGAVSGNRRLQSTALLAAQSLLITAATVEGIKWVGGRRRPGDGDDAWDWGGPGSLRNSSFVSGHAAAAFAAASVVAEQYRDTPVVPIVSYGLATGVALSRINDDGHFLSDVVGGALVGYGIGRLTTGMSPFDNDNVSLNAYHSGDEVGVQLSVRY